MKDRNPLGLMRRRAAVIGSVLALALIGASNSWPPSTRRDARPDAASPPSPPASSRCRATSAAESRRSGAAVGMTLGFAKGLGGLVVRHLGRRLRDRDRALRGSGGVPPDSTAGISVELFRPVP